MSDDWDVTPHTNSDVSEGTLIKTEPITEVVAISHAPMMCEHCGRFYASRSMCAACADEVLIDLRDARSVEMILEQDTQRKKKRFNSWLKWTLMMSVSCGLVLIFLGVYYKSLQSLFPLMFEMLPLLYMAYPVVAIAGAYLSHRMLAHYRPVKQLGETIPARIALDDPESSMLALYSSADTSLSLTPREVISKVGGVVGFFGFFGAWFTLGIWVEYYFNMVQWLGHEGQGSVASLFLVPASLIWWLGSKLLKRHRRL